MPEMNPLHIPFRPCSCGLNIECSIMRVYESVDKMRACELRHSAMSDAGCGQETRTSGLLVLRLCRPAGTGLLASNDLRLGPALINRRTKYYQVRNISSTCRNLISGLFPWIEVSPKPVQAQLGCRFERHASWLSLFHTALARYLPVFPLASLCFCRL